MDLELLAGVAFGFWATHQVTKTYDKVRDQIDEYKGQVQHLLEEVQEQRQAFLNQGAEFLTSDAASVVPEPGPQTGAENQMQGRYNPMGMYGASHSYAGRSAFQQAHRQNMGFIPYPAWK